MIFDIHQSVMTSEFLQRPGGAQPAPQASFNRVGQSLAGPNVTQPYSESPPQTTRQIYCSLSFHEWNGVVQYFPWLHKRFGDSTQVSCGCSTHRTIVVSRIELVLSSNNSLIQNGLVPLSSVQLRGWSLFQAHLLLIRGLSVIKCQVPSP